MSHSSPGFALFLSRAHLHWHESTRIIPSSRRWLWDSRSSMMRTTISVTRFLRLMPGWRLVENVDLLFLAPPLYRQMNCRPETQQDPPIEG